MESVKYTSAYDVPIASVDGEENFLKQYRGKVTLFANTTGDCGNAPQFAAWRLRLPCGRT